MVELKVNIPNVFWEEEERCGYLVSRQMKEVWAVELDLLAEFDRVCKNNGIKYIASGGTMLGAVRHKGFIPWDDDLDVMMLREDYEKLVTIAKKEFKNPYFFLTTTRGNDFICGYSKLCNSNTTALIKSIEGVGYKYNQGIFIDIFPLDKVCDNNLKFGWQVLQAKYHLKMSWLCQKYQYGIVWEKRSGLRIIVDLLYKIFHNVRPDVFDCYSNIEKLNSICCRYNQDRTTYISLISFQPGNRVHDLLLVDMDDLIDSDFEFLKIPIPRNFDDHLRRKYGKYNTPINTGGYHGEIFFDTNKPYLSYLGK